MLFKFLLITSFFVQSLTAFAQDSAFKSFKEISCAEKWWVITHPFVAKKALKISQLARIKTDSIQQKNILNGTGNGDQVDAFRHTFWMAKLTQAIGSKKARKLGVAHEKGNKRDFKKGNKEEGSLPDKISSEMDLFNNTVGIAIGKERPENLVQFVIEEVKKGNCKIIKKDTLGNFLDCDGNIIPTESLKGKWENTKCLVKSNE
jgi:hypothetical protein